MPDKLGKKSVNKEVFMSTMTDPNDIILTHECKGLDKANTKGNTSFTIRYCSSYISIFDSNKPPTRGELSWKLLNNDDDYYSAEYINYCPYCGKKL